MKMVALIPARAGSKRIPGKNTRLLAGEPLIAWTIRAAQASGVFDLVLVSTDDPAIGDIVQTLNGDTPIRQRAKWIERPAELATDDAPDIGWVRHAIGMAAKYGENYLAAPFSPFSAFAILRPTSPFRTAETIQRAYKQFIHDETHSLRAVQPVKEHPGKVWEYAGRGYPMTPILNRTRLDGTPWHSSPTQSLPTFYIQNASLEMAWTYVVTSFGTISGNKVAPFFTEGYEGFDLNTEEDWQQAERLLAEGTVALPTLARV